MKEILKNIIGSFDNSSTGASGKKLTALFAMIFCFVTPVITWTYWAFNHNDFSLLSGILTIVTTFICLLFGINVYDKIKNNDTPK